MLTWMQHHKKYLIITIWISVIAFVGAGFVGWGSYSMNKNKTSAVAKVGNSYITIRDFNQKYSNLFSYYNSIFQGNFTQEQAEAAKLQDIAINQLIQEQMFLNFAKEIGLQATKNEILDVIVYDRTFHEDGKFNKNRYLEVLKQNGIYPSDYEDSLEREITLKKLFENLETRVDKIEFEALNGADFIEDELKIKIITHNNEDIEVDNNDLRVFWEINSDKYQTLKTYELQIAKITPKQNEFSEDDLKDFYTKNRDIFITNDDALLSFEEAKENIKKELALDNIREDALKDYILAKKGELDFDGTVLFDSQTLLPTNVKLSDIEEMSINEVLKPIKSDGSFIILKLTKINPPQAMSFESAKEQALVDFKIAQSQELLIAKAKSELENFEGINIGFINLNKPKDIEGLNSTESNELLSKIKAQNLRKNFIILNNKAIIYDIISQRVNFDELNSDKNINFLEEKAKSIKNVDIKMNILKELSRRYKVARYF